jgi:hypothetical protein
LKNKTKSVEDMAQELECLPSKCEVLSSNATIPLPPKKTPTGKYIFDVACISLEIAFQAFHIICDKLK